LPTCLALRCNDRRNCRLKFLRCDRMWIERHAKLVLSWTWTLFLYLCAGDILDRYSTFLHGGMIAPVASTVFGFFRSYLVTARAHATTSTSFLLFDFGVFVCS
jgi:hypothetical protein